MSANYKHNNKKTLKPNRLGIVGVNPTAAGYLGGNNPAIPASTVAQTNTFKTTASVYVTGGTVTSIDVGGNSTGLTTGMVTVPAGSTIALTYSVAPTWKWFSN